MDEIDPSRALTVYDPEKLARDEELVERDFWQKVRGTLGKVPFTEDAVAGYYCATDGNTPTYVKAVLLAAIAYFIMPADVIPDVIAGLGFTDDASVLTAAFAAVSGHLKPHHRDQARSFLEKPPLEDEPDDG